MTHAVTTDAHRFAIPDLTDEVSIRDFTVKKKRIQFKIDDDVFTATAILGLPLMQDMIQLTRNIGKLAEEGSFESITTIFKELLDETSAVRFVERVNSRKIDEAIDVKQQLIPILYFLLEQYGLRPTQPSPASPTGSPSGTGGTSSEAGPFGEESTSVS